METYNLDRAQFVHSKDTMLIGISKYKFNSLELKFILIKRVSKLHSSLCKYLNWLYFYIDITIHLLNWESWWWVQIYIREDMEIFWKVEELVTEMVRHNMCFYYSQGFTWRDKKWKFWILYTSIIIEHPNSRL